MYFDFRLSKAESTKREIGFVLFLITKRLPYFWRLSYTFRSINHSEHSSSHMKNLLVLTGFFILNIQLVQAQLETIKWGKISEEEINIQGDTSDSSAVAVVLGDFGEISVNIRVEGIEYRLRRHRRVKIFSEQASGQTTVRIPYFNGENAEKISALKAQIFSPDGRKRTLNKKDFKDKLLGDGQSVRVFSFPDAGPGSIIEYRYELVSDRIIQLRDWYFQEDIPVRYSELKVEIPEWLEYVALTQGDIQLMKNARDNAVALEIDNESVLERDPRVRLQTIRYFLKNVPPIKESPYVASLEDYRARVRFCLNKIYYPNGKSQDYMVSWDDLAVQLKAMDHFGQQYRNTANYSKLLAATRSLVAKDARKEKQVEMLYDYLNKEVKWSGKYSIYSSSLDEAFSRKEAASGEFNLMLIALLQERGIDARPLLISTRSKGSAIQQYPFLNQFNHVLVKVMMEDDHSLLLDLSDAVRPCGYPQIEALNSYGWLLNDEKGEWTIIEPKPGNDLMVMTGELTGEGILKGVIRNKYEGYSAVEERKQYQKNELGKYWLERFGTTDSKAMISSFEATNADQITEPLQTEFQFSLPGIVEVEGDKMSFNPVLFTEYSISQLPDEARQYPVDIAYPFKEQFVSQVKIPEGYEVESLPESARILIRGGGGTYHYILKENEGHLELISKIQVKQLKYQSEDYADIKAFFDIIAAKSNEKIILRRIRNE